MRISLALAAVLSLALAVVLPRRAHAQPTHAQPDRRSPLQVTADLFAALNRGDAERVGELLHPDVQLTTLRTDRGRNAVQSAARGDFLASVARADSGQLDERTGRVTLRVDGPLAQAWVPYQLYVDGAFVHCGANALTLVADESGRWSILRVVDTRRERDCPALSDAADRTALDSLTDAWHRAAAAADSVQFFGAMSADGVYLGTDATERWVRDTMAAWAAPYFARDTAWAFVPLERHWAFAEDGRTAWFDERLDTWMGPIRGSGVWTRSAADGPAGARWRLRHYNLAFTVPNDRVGAVRQAIDTTLVLDPAASD